MVFLEQFRYWMTIEFVIPNGTISTTFGVIITFFLFQLITRLIIFVGKEAGKYVYRRVAGLLERHI